MSTPTTLPLNGSRERFRPKFTSLASINMSARVIKRGSCTYAIFIKLFVCCTISVITSLYLKTLDEGTTTHTCYGLNVFIVYAIVLYFVYNREYVKLSMYTDIMII